MYAKFNTIEDFNNWHSKINEVKGFAEGKPTTQYTQAIPKEGEKVVYAVVDNSCPIDLKPKVTITNEEFNALNWLPIENI